MIRRTVKYVVGALALAVAAVLLIGALLPQAHEASSSARFGSPPERVFAALVDVERYPEWRDDVTAVEVLGRDPLRWRERSGGDTITFEVVERSPPARLRVRIADADLPFGGSWTYSLEPESGGTRLTIVEQGEVYNPVFRFVSRFVIGHTATIERVMSDIRKRLDRPDGQP
jgi:uncharacterized membrane protein